MIQPDQPLAQLTEVVRQFGTGATAIRAIDGVSLAVGPGERIAVVGPSGAGKSTLLSLLGLIDRVDEGEVRLRGEAANDLSEDARADLRREHIGFVFQLFHLIPALSALENVAVPLLPYASRRPILERAEGLLLDLGLGDRLRNRPGELSGGEQQRVGIARALIGQPDLVLADEPTGNLDSKTGIEIMALFARLHQGGNTIIVVTHEAEIAAYAHRVIAIRDGQVERDVKQQPHAHTAV